MTEKIKALARVLGQVPEEDEEALAALCAAAETELRGGLRAGLDPERDCEGAFVQAAAWLALDALARGKRGDGVTAVTAGDFTVRRTAAADGGEGLRKLARRLMAPYLRDGEFCFRGVPG